MPPAAFDEHSQQSEGYSASGQLLLKSLTWPQLEGWCAANGERPQRARQLWRWLYHAEGGWPNDAEQTLQLQNGLSQQFLETMRGRMTFDGGIRLQSVHTASDGTRKLLFTLADGSPSDGLVETVMIPIVRRQGDRQRITVCVSSQIGCAMNCQFCYTGKMGLKVNLNAAHIVEQVIMARRLLAADAGLLPADQAPSLTNVVFMGMGEPMSNLGAVLAAVHIMCHPQGLQLSHKKVTVSTVGLVPEMQRFTASSRAQLAVSLHATTDEVRDWLCPVNRRWPLAALLGALARDYPRRPNGAASRHFVLIEYVMLSGVNDTLDDAHRLVGLLQPIDCKVNLIVFNTHEGTDFKPSTPEAVQAFRSIVIQAGRVCTVRDSRGDEEMAACGQLGAPDVTLPRAPPKLQPPVHLQAAVQ
jgi:23S rRNA (adenine2503-C2)-methyltransferase